jgi:aldehyde dehydrogenase (NAD+)
MLQNKHYINGQWCTSLADVDSAVVAARNAFYMYKQTSAQERISLIQTLYTIYKSRVKEIGELISKEMGSPITIAQSWQVEDSYIDFENAIDLLNKFSFKDGILRYEPIGVCGIITPWNWPIVCITETVLPALAAGCTVVLKPSSLAPSAPIMFAECVHEAGFPAGVFNLISGAGELGQAITQHPDIDMISFMGSNETGHEVSKSAAGTLKRVVQELGGKSPAIIFNDYEDLQHAVEKRVNNCMNNSGQCGPSSTRILVHKDQYDIAVDMAIAAANNIEVNYSAVEGYHMGPVASRAQLDHIKKLIQEGIDAGARIVAGGLDHPNHLYRGNGNFIKPTVFADVDNSMSIAQKEIFGPVLCMISFENEDDAIRIANDSIYKLAAYVYTSSSSKADRVAQQLQVDNVYINDSRYIRSCEINNYLKIKRIVHSKC